jgi:hypothetical protein
LKTQAHRRRRLLVDCVVHGFAGFFNGVLNGLAGLFGGLIDLFARVCIGPFFSQPVKTNMANATSMRNRCLRCFFIVISFIE